MISEVLYMQIRLFQQFCERNKMSSVAANKLFKECAIWKYIEDCYDTLHMSGDEYILGDIQQIIAAKGVKL